MGKFSLTDVVRTDGNDSPFLKACSINLKIPSLLISRSPDYVCCKGVSAFPAFPAALQLWEFNKLLNSHRQMQAFPSPQETLQSQVSGRGRDCSVILVWK